MLSKEAVIKNYEIPKTWNIDAADFANKVKITYYTKLLKRSANDRLGRNNINEIKDHPWLKDINWTQLYKKQFPSPYIPKVKLKVI